ncbi:MAG TPA: ABC transporter ATP-binding protein [Solirubrobacteraceae bacterium]|jgi:peptide/nickel transport system ATP-binding protein|nr:ABC transporter ATP-binding protein [Solirubrobacteraceae bacterium]
MTESHGTQPLLDIRDLSIAYRSPDGDTRAVRGVDLALHPGSIVGLAGESGCGKSTLAYGSVRLLRPPAVITAGSVTYHGRRIAGGGFDVLGATAPQLRALRWREIAIVFQSAMNALNPVLRIGEQLLDALRAHTPAPEEQLRARAIEMLELVGIPPARLRSYPHELSGGMRQRVMIAMALSVEPEVVIMDEPTTGLDVVVQREILRQVFELKDRLGFSVLFITHDLSLLLEVADRVVIMYAGQVVESAPTVRLRGGAAHPYTRGLLDSFPSLRGERRQLSGIPGSPPDLRGELAGCPFVSRCAFSTDKCGQVDMRLRPVDGGGNGSGAAARAHVTACPFVTAYSHPIPLIPSPAVAALGAASSPPRAPAAAAAGGGHDGRLVLEAVNLSKEYRQGRGRGASVIPAVQEVSFGLRRGWVVALVGESGSGKSTIAKLLAGQERRTGGEIRLDGARIDPAARRQFRAYKSEVQMVFQDPFASLNPLHTVRYHLERALRVHQARTGRASGVAEVEALLEQVSLTPARKFSDAYPHELSGGQRQRVSIARALAAAPRVLLADEPVSMLDVSIRLEVLDLIADLRTRLDLAVLYITHDIASARYFADEILVMHAGRIVERGPAEKLTQNPTHPYTQLLIASSPDPDSFTAPPGGEALALAAGDRERGSPG